MAEHHTVSPQPAGPAAAHVSSHHSDRAELLAVHDLDGRVRLLSPGWTAVLGPAMAQRLLGGYLVDVVHPEDRDLALAAREAVLGHDRHVIVELRLMTVDGLVPVEVVARPPLPGQRAYVVVLNRLP